MLRDYALKVEFEVGAVGLTAAQVMQNSTEGGTVQWTIENADASDTLFVGGDSSVGVDPGQHFIGGNLASGDTIVLENWRGPVWVIGSGATTDYVAERRYSSREGRRT